MSIEGHDTVVKGGVLFALADTLAAHSIGGFKMGVGFSLRKCRMCLATKEQVSINVSNSAMYIGKIFFICKRCFCSTNVILNSLPLPFMQ